MLSEASFCSQLTMGEQAVHLSNARLAGRTLSKRERKPRICGGGINTSGREMEQSSKRSTLGGGAAVNHV